MIMVKKKRKVTSNNIILFLVVVIIIIIIVFSIRQTGEQIETVEEELIEESTGSGFIEIETLPSNAEIFMDDIYSGVSPITLYNIPVGPHNIVIKKEGYEDFTSEVSVEAGRKTFLEADLALIPIEEKTEIIEIVEEEIEESSAEEETLTEGLKATGTVNIGKKILFYYDLSEEKFTDNKQVDSDIFSKRFNTYIVFTRYGPVNIKTIDKSIDNVKKEDCIDIKGQFEFLNSGKSLCVITKENQIVALGGTWESTENAELTWKLYS